MVDRDLLLRKASDLEQYLGQLAEYRGVTVEQYRGDWRTQRIVERTLQLAIEACSDIAGHVIADRRLRVPTTYAEAFEILGEVGILGAPTRDAMIRVARFRNILVHEYTRIDPALVTNVLQHHLQDLTAFLHAILRLA
jgi:uncharacterized protein YutE (UPF0331/DUF86 family)